MCQGENHKWQHRRQRGANSPHALLQVKKPFNLMAFLKTPYGMMAGECAGRDQAP